MLICFTFSEGDNLKKVLCGINENLDYKYTSYSTTLSLLLHTDSSSNYKGFKILWEAVQPGEYGSLFWVPTGF